MKKKDKVVIIATGQEGVVANIDGNAVTVKTANGEVIVAQDKVRPLR